MMDVAGNVLYHALHLAARATTDPSSTITSSATLSHTASSTLTHTGSITSTYASSTSSTASATSTAAAAPARPPVYKVVGIVLAICSGLFIGVSFVMKKIGLLKANVKYHEEAGEGYGYLKNVWWWGGMTLMILGEICNFVAYAFTDAILVTPLGALSVVLTTILSWIFLKERLSFVGWVACFLCILGSIVITLNAPQQSEVADIQQMQHYVLSPGFLVYAGLIIAACLVIIFFVAPKYGKKSMMVYLSVCSLIGGLSVVATQGLGAAILAQINGNPQFNKWFLYILFVFVVATLLTEIVFLNKALNLFNAALVTPTYYVYFTSSTIVASAVLFQGFHGTAIQIIDVILGFLTICSGVILLQLAKSSKDVPDSKVLSGNIDDVRTVAEVQEPEYEPRADTIRGGAGIVRALSRVRTKRQHDEAVRIHSEMMEPIPEGQAYWDGLRRRKTVSSHGGGSVVQRKPLHPPLGMSDFPTDEDDISEPDSEVHPGFFGRIGRRRGHSSTLSQKSGRSHSPGVPLETVRHVPNIQKAPTAFSEHLEPSVSGSVISGPHHYNVAPHSSGHYDEDTAYHPVTTTTEGPHVRWRSDTVDSGGSGAGLAPPRPPPHSPNSPNGGNRRQFSFTNVFHRHRDHADHGDGIGGGGAGSDRPISRGALSFTSRGSQREYPTGGPTTEEERLGLVTGDSKVALTGGRRGGGGNAGRQVGREHSGSVSSDEWQMTSGTASSPEAIGRGEGKAEEGGDLARSRTRDTYDSREEEEDPELETGPPVVPRGEEEDERRHPGRSFV